MGNSEILSLAIGLLGVLWGVIREYSTRQSLRQEGDVKELARDLATKHSDLYEKVISTQKEFTNSSNRLSLALDRLTQTIDHVETQASERHNSLNARVTDMHVDVNKRFEEFHEAQELVRLRIHWIINKLTVLKFNVESNGKSLGGEWNAP